MGAAIKKSLQEVNLNLLLALHALLKERHISNAAERVGLSQPAMSRALQRLRKEFNDSLLVKGAGGYELTPRAMALEAPLRQLVSDLEAIYTEPVFDPAEAQGEFCIAALDYEFIVLLPMLTERLRLVAPGITIKALPFTGDDFEPLMRGEVHLVLTAIEQVPENLYRQALYDEKNACMVNPQFLESHPELSVGNFTKLDHIWVYLRNNDPGKIDDTLDKMGIKRNIVNTTPTFFLSAFTVASSTNLVTVLPERVENTLCKNLPITTIDTPIPFETFTIYQVWHERSLKDKKHKFIRQLIVDICKNV